MGEAEGEGQTDSVLSMEPEPKPRAGLLTEGAPQVPPVSPIKVTFDRTNKPILIDKLLLTESTFYSDILSFPQISLFGSRIPSSIPYHV